VFWEGTVSGRRLFWGSLIWCRIGMEISGETDALGRDIPDGFKQVNEAQIQNT